MARAVGAIARGLGKVFDGLGSSLGFGYRETLNKAQCVQAFAGKQPVLGDDVFVAPNASVIGDVKLGSGSSVWYGAVIRGDVNSVSIGDKTSVQDNVLIHVAKHNAAGQALPTVIGSRVTIGPGATVHAATIEDCVVIGMGATIMDGVKVESRTVVAAGALVPPGTTIPSGQVWAGSPAKFIRNLVEDEAAFVAESADTTAQLAALHAEENAKSFDEVEADKARRADRLERDPDYDEQQGVQRNFITRDIEKLADST
ncbi:gamma carbonic anhydrase mitochondrial [Chlorella sorokiniana]|jgi:carbonic anhydrase/acetyltransferase-like protein (isoleucine patch superfamily)|uniref:Gamma carbonic anhydrase mitochondrial n=1 Tax=Chlorella sorokiniana TaxID=3076 RepID=A0A2P6TU66_CHLSO|nr:gamma carbonic anhydrase mitochondrial [Chlorella sorokiniana]|eukprot:PRW57618.1 gamma carbonic anhydrase mitochondrial [Chlorella sorokiniana]